MLASLGSFYVAFRWLEAIFYCLVSFVVWYLLLLGILSCILSLGTCYNSKVDVRRCWCCSIHKEPCLPLSTGKHSTLRMLQHAKTSDVGVAYPEVASINFLLAKIITEIICFSHCVYVESSATSSSLSLRGQLSREMASSDPMSNDLTN